MRWENRVGSRIRQIRKNSGQTQEALAFEAGIAMRYLAGIERGEENPSLLVLVKIASALQVQPGSLFEG
ncbi:helix-turn-helix transcriptional regulator [Brevundimonas sp.]|uniref:helix-turn-helix domain-containing protein n=1 Tax=Brevundimonas sp. TaxID=1871086 RepID=UPI0024891C0F|nr:helix-turn-helix transcriptional regulator [Brevundimonas sp.]MDI1281518.1 helix-turn-helix transcriptional regulator [Brevundimonas sp.]